MDGACGVRGIDVEGRLAGMRKAQEYCCFRGLRAKSNVPKTAEYRFEGTSPESRFQARVDDLDVGGSRVYRIDVSAFSGLACERNRCFGIWRGCVNGLDVGIKNAAITAINRYLST